MDAEKKKSLSKILRDYVSGPSFVDTLQGAKAIRHSLLRKTGKSMTPHDIRREADRKEGFEMGRQEGFEVGRAEAFAASKTEFDTLNHAQNMRFAQGLENALVSFESDVKSWYSHAETRLADLAIEIARRAISQELEQSRESILAIAHEVLGEATEGSKVRLRVNPLDGSAVEARKRDLIAAFSHLKSIEIVEDRSVEFGCKLETDAGMIDARVEDFLARIIATAKKGR